MRIVRHNWDLLGKSPSSSFIHERKLVCGYRRPKNLMDRLVRANIPFTQGDERARPDFVQDQDPLAEQSQDVAMGWPCDSSERYSKNYDRFFQKHMPTLEAALSPRSDTDVRPKQQIPVSKTLKLGTSAEERGFKFWNRKVCRYCPQLNKSGTLLCSATGSTFHSMKISCRSSNLIYCVTCKVCTKQYVGQTLLRIKDRFKGHFYDVTKEDKSKAVGRHFCRPDHSGIQDIEISVLEFIKKPPRSPEASLIRDRVEKRWIHLLRCPAPSGLNIFD